MIQQCYSKYYIICDICEEPSTAFDSFREAIDGKQEAGYSSQRDDGQWIDVCEECSEAL